jgi:hypothetical protein
MKRLPVPPTLPELVPPSVQLVWPLAKSPFSTRLDVAVTGPPETDGVELRSSTTAGHTVMLMVSVAVEKAVVPPLVVVFTPAAPFAPLV